ncbi:MAG: 2-C-methyl-D-erythritol 4-phosphate cytidylyltransferase [Dorea sp.]|nr:2-C-methyl-D-erythritol 4-phosphate cytidylyltransferase [Dorea sp.]MDY2814050.1 IspD/TarI family cytidylyltransferase [Dorea sp.]
MNIALIFAGGSGKRMNSKSRPKQFLELHGKEIIIYTIEHFERHPEIDAIVVVCIEEWIDYLKTILKKNGIEKVKWIVPGGETGQDSIYNGLQVIHENCPEDSIVLIHDGVRPLITAELISDNIQCVKEHGSAVTVAPVTETVMLTADDKLVYTSVERDKCRMAKAPQGYYLKDIYAAHKKAIAENVHNKIDSATMMSDYGYSLYTVEGGPENIKITTPSDFYIFRALLDEMENSQIFGI